MYKIHRNNRSLQLETNPAPSSLARQHFRIAGTLLILIFESGDVAISSIGFAFMAGKGSPT